MKQKRVLVTMTLFTITVLLLGMIIYISTLLGNGTNSPTVIKKTKASNISYHKSIDIKTGNLNESINQFATSPTPSVASSTVSNSLSPVSPTLIAKAQLTPSIAKQAVATGAPVVSPTTSPIVVEPSSKPSPTLLPLLAYKSTSLSPTPTLIPVRNTNANGGTTTSNQNVSPTKKPYPTAVQTLPETGWVQTSTILFIVATTTILFSLLF